MLWKVYGPTRLVFGFIFPPCVMSSLGSNVIQCLLRYFLPILIFKTLFLLDVFSNQNSFTGVEMCQGPEGYKVDAGGKGLCEMIRLWWEVRTERWLIEARRLPIGQCLAEKLTDGGAGADCDGKSTIFLQDPNIEILLNLIRMEEEDTQSSFILTSDSRDSCCQFEYFSMDSGNWHGNRKILKAVKSLSKLFEENFNWHFAYPKFKCGMDT